MFDKFMGLPMHILILHFTVVLVPLVSIATIAVFLWPAWRQKFAGPVAIANVAMLALTFVTVRAGLKFKDRFQILGDKRTPGFDHERWGKDMLWWVLALASVAVVVWGVGRLPNLPAMVGTGLGGVVAVLAVVTIVFTAVAGHTGAEASYKGIIKGSDKKINQLKTTPPTAK
ncbi:MAG TPA: DUF2231 domain-containing protein [Sporichthyaceae bacterium]|nr:DUF2231 domain-containing protein [Sporichthyaceae bacterium]